MLKMKSFDLDVYHKIKGDKPQDSAKIIQFLKERFFSITSDPRISEESENFIHIKGEIAGTLRFVGVDANIRVDADGNSARIRFEGKQYWGLMFWVCYGCVAFMFLIHWLLAVLPLILLGILQSQVKTKPKELIDQIIKETDMEFS